MTGRIEGFNHGGITVRSIAAERGFFEVVLGLREAVTVDLDETFSSGITGIEGARMQALLLEVAGVTVELLEYAGAESLPRRPISTGDPGSAHLALFVRGLDEIVAAADAHGWRPAGRIQPITTGPRSGGRAVYLRNPDGATVELVELPPA